MTPRSVPVHHCRLHDTSSDLFGTLIVLAIGGLPGFRVDRTGAGIIGASPMICFDVVSMEEVFRSINYETIFLLFCMMIVVANLRLSGFFAAVSTTVVQRAHQPFVLLVAIVVVSVFFSAFFVNDNHVSGPDAARARYRAPLEAQSRTLPADSCDGL